MADPRELAPEWGLAMENMLDAYKAFWAEEEFQHRVHRGEWRMRGDREKLLMGEALHARERFAYAMSRMEAETINAEIDSARSVAIVGEFMAERAQGIFEPATLTLEGKIVLDARTLDMAPLEDLLAHSCRKLFRTFKGLIAERRTRPARFVADAHAVGPDL